MIIRLSGVLLVILGLLYIRDVSGEFVDRIKTSLFSVVSENPSVAGISTSTEDDGVAAREILVITSTGMYPINAEEARSESERQRGLMFRDSLCSSCGMLFFNDSDTKSGFWMKNCEFPLDVIFIDKDKSIVDIKEDFAPCKSNSCPIYRPQKAYRYVLEVNGGWAKNHKLEIGDTVTF